MGRPGRPEAPVDHTNPALGRLAQFLRDKRGSVPYRTLAERSRWGASSLKRAAAGKTLPTWDCVQGYLSACGVDSASEYRYALVLLQVAKDMYKSRPSRSVDRPRPDLVFDRADLSRALRSLYAVAGSPPIRAFSERAGTYLLPRSTAHRIITGQAVPNDLFQYLGFLVACEVRDENLSAWFLAWSRASGENPHSQAERTQYNHARIAIQYTQWAAEQQEYAKSAWLRERHNSPSSARRPVCQLSRATSWL
ncbi:hypothetical protein [Streptomyces sp. NPDC004266]|uniref:hypothetical protein n=1 Tax=Streptomyces sp. NPDC004266 TaxID=3364693 RepID=UPI00368E30F5